MPVSHRPPPRTTPVQEARPIYFGTPTKSVAWFPLYVAMKRGFLRKEGLNLQQVVLDSRVIVPSLATKEIPYSTGLGSAMIGASKGLPLLKQFVGLANLELAGKA